MPVSTQQMTKYQLLPQRCRERRGLQYFVFFKVSVELSVNADDILSIMLMQQSYEGLHEKASLIFVTIRHGTLVRALERHYIRLVAHYALRIGYNLGVASASLQDEYFRLVLQGAIRRAVFHDFRMKRVHLSVVRHNRVVRVSVTHDKHNQTAVAAEVFL